MSRISTGFILTPPSKKTNKKRNSLTLASNAQNANNTDALFEKLMSDPVKKQLVLKLLESERENIEEYKRNEAKKKARDLNQSPSVSKIKQKQQCESPTALFRRRALEQLKTGSGDTDSVRSASRNSNASSEQSSVPSPVPFEQIMKDVVCYIEIRREGQDKSAGVKAVMKAMGATVCDSFSKNVTHVIFKDGSFTTYQKAKLKGLFLVSVLWVDFSRKLGIKQSEKMYPAMGCYNNNVSTICSQMYKEYEDIIKEEYHRSMVEGTPLPSTKSLIERRRTLTTPSVSFRMSQEIPSSQNSQDFEVETILRRKTICTQSKIIEEDVEISDSESDNEPIINGNILKSSPLKSLENIIESDSNLSDSSICLIPTSKNSNVTKRKSCHMDITDIVTSTTQSSPSKKNKQNNVNNMNSDKNKTASSSMSSLQISADKNISNNSKSDMSSLQISHSQKMNSDKNKNTSQRSNRTSNMSSLQILSENKILNSDNTSMNSDKNKSTSRNSNRTSNMSSLQISSENRILHSDNANMKSDKIQNSSENSNRTSNMSSLQVLSENRILNSDNKDMDSDNCNKTSKNHSGRFDIRNSHSDNTNINSDNASGTSINNVLPNNIEIYSGNCGISKNLNSDNNASSKSASTPSFCSAQEELIDSDDILQAIESIESPNKVDNITKRRRTRCNLNSDSSEIISPSPRRSMRNRVVKTPYTPTAKRRDKIDVLSNVTIRKCRKKLEVSEKSESETSDDSAKKFKKLRKLYDADESLKSVCDEKERQEKRKKAEIENKIKNNDVFLNPANVNLKVVLSDISRKNKKNISTSSESESDISIELLPTKKQKSKPKYTKKMNLNSSLDRQDALLNEIINKKQNTQMSTPTNRRSTLEFQKTPTQKGSLKKIKPNIPKQPTIVCTKLHQDDVITFCQIVKKLGKFVVEDEVSNNTTHVVAGEPKRTINMLRGVARGCWILRHEWLFKSLEVGRWLPEEDFEVTNFAPIVQRSRLQRQAFGSDYTLDVFENVGAIYVTRGSNPRCSDLRELITLCKGKSVLDPLKAKIIVGEYFEGDNICVGETWVLDCITQNKVKPFKKYLIRSGEKSKKSIVV